MALSNKNFDEICESDLNDLRVAGVPEGVLLDYKRESYGRSDSDVREVLKDISSFANTSGGHLLIGIEEDAGIPVRLSPLTTDPDQELQRLESLARDGIEPRIVGLRMKAVPISAGGFVLVLRIPKSWNPPHRVSARNTNRIYGRNSAGAYEFSVEELRVVFTAAASALDRVRAFRSQRLAKIDSDEAIVPLAKGGDRLVLHLVPASSFGLGNQIDLEAASAIQQLLHPIGVSGFSPQINFDGFCNLHSDTDGKCRSYTQVFRNGAIEAIKVHIITKPGPGQFRIPALALEKWIFEYLANYLSALQTLEVPPPIILMITLQGVRGARLETGPGFTEDRPASDRNVLELPEIVIEQYGTEVDYQRAAKPAFDALWNSGGFARSKHFDGTGRWAPPRH